MKKTAVIGGSVTAALFLVLVFFTFFGDKVYKAVTPKVKTIKLNGYTMRDGEKYCVLDASVFAADGSVCIITSEAGFSRTIYRLERYTPTKTIPDERTGGILVPEKEFRGKTLAAEPEKLEGMKEGTKVIAVK